MMADCVARCEPAFGQQRLQQPHQRKFGDMIIVIRQLAPAFMAFALSVSEVASCSPRPAWSLPVGCSQMPPPSRRPIINGHNVQPKAFEFASPCGSPDIAAQGADEVDRLYVEIMRRALRGPKHQIDAGNDVY